MSKIREQRLEEALRNLCDKLDEVTKDTKGLFTLAYAHGRMYQGANYGAELKVARAALAAPADAPACSACGKSHGPTECPFDEHTPEAPTPSEPPAQGRCSYRSPVKVSWNAQCELSEGHANGHVISVDPQDHNKDAMEPADVKEGKQNA